jgi:lysophospholipase L1-like esterase
MTRIVLWTLGFLLCGELFLQVRSEIKSGVSVIDRLYQTPSYQVNPLFGVKTLTPHVKIKGGDVAIQANNLGLRDRDLPQEKPANEIRIAFIGASTVMGAYAKNNEVTVANLLEQQLLDASPTRFNIINAGIAGLTSKEQARVLEVLIRDYQLDGVIIYTGLNELSSHCKTNRTVRDQFYQLELPRWLMSRDLLIKNTTFLRDTPALSMLVEPAPHINTQGYQQGLQAMLRLIRDRELPYILIENGKAYRQDQSESDQLSFSETARYYAHCFDLEDLYYAYQIYNQALEVEAARWLNHQGVVLALEDLVPGGRTFFADSVHLTKAGEVRLARRLQQEVLALFKEGV